MAAPTPPPARSATRCAVYLRVSRDDGTQTEQNQLLDLTAYAAARGWETVGPYVDRASGGRASGGRGRADRAAFDRMMADALRRRFDVVLFWALDRLTREGVSTTFGYVERLADAGVSIHSYTQPLLSTAGENRLVRDIVLAVLAAVAEDERARISERTRAGLRRARAAGVRLGRPSKLEAHRTALTGVIDGVAARVASGELDEAVAETARRREAVAATGLSYNTAAKYLAQIRGAGPRAPKR